MISIASQSVCSNPSHLRSANDAFLTSARDTENDLLVTNSSCAKTAMHLGLYRNPEICVNLEVNGTNSALHSKLRLRFNVKFSKKVMCFLFILGNVKNVLHLYGLGVYGSLT